MRSDTLVQQTTTGWRAWAHNGTRWKVLTKDDLTLEEALQVTQKHRDTHEPPACRPHSFPASIRP